jgi:DNA-binding XRE family transcriptional regulator
MPYSTINSSSPSSRGVDDLADELFSFQPHSGIAELKAARETAGLTVAQVAERTGLTVESLVQLEAGVVTNPTWKTLALYAAAVGR